MAISEGVAPGELTEVLLKDSSGADFATSSNPLRTDPTGSTIQPVSGTVTANAGTNLNTSALALETTQAAQNVLVGAVTETAPSTDIASSGLNGRLQRIAQRITSLITMMTDRSQKTQLSDGTNDLVFKNVPLALTDYAVPVRSIPYEPKGYSAVASAFAPASSATDIFTISGSASKTIRIHKIDVTGTTTSGSPIKITICLQKRSTANTGGTSVTRTNVPHDSSNAAATAEVKSYTANPTLGTLVGNVRCVTTSFQASGITDTVLMWEFADDGGQPIILRGVNESLVVNFNGTTVTGGVVSISVEWSEV